MDGCIMCENSLTLAAPQKLLNLLEQVFDVRIVSSMSQALCVCTRCEVNMQFIRGAMILKNEMHEHLLETLEAASISGALFEVTAAVKESEMRKNDDANLRTTPPILSRYDIGTPRLPDQSTSTVVVYNRGANDVAELSPRAARMNGHGLTRRQLVEVVRDSCSVPPALPTDPASDPVSSTNAVGEVRGDEGLSSSGHSVCHPAESATGHRPTSNCAASNAESADGPTAPETKTKSRKAAGCDFSSTVDVGGCSQHSSVANSTRNDERTMADDGRSCTGCGKLFRAKAWLSRHLHVCRKNQQASNSNAGPYSCSKCGKDYASQYTKFLKHAEHCHATPVSSIANSLRSYRAVKDVAGALTTSRAGNALVGTVVGKPNMKTYNCPLCSRLFIVRRDLYLKHVRACRSKQSKSQRALALEQRRARGARRAIADKTSPSSHVCPKCNRSFSGQSELGSHAEVCKDRSSGYTCSSCGKKYTRKDEYANHVCSSTNSESGVQDNQNDALGIASTEVSPQVFVCLKCSVAFNHQSELDLHVQICEAKSTHDSRLVCGKCCRSYLYKAFYAKHVQICKATPTPKMSKMFGDKSAPPAGATLKSKKPSNQHGESAQRSRVCATPFKRDFQYSCGCGKKYRWRCNIVKHSRTCPSFVTESDMRDSEDENVSGVTGDGTAAPTYACPKCERSFSRQDDHDQHVHTCKAPIERPLRHPRECATKYVSLGNYARHKRTYTRARGESVMHEEEDDVLGIASDGTAASTYACPECKRSFSCQKELDQHAQVCTARLKKPIRHSCGCGKKYSTLGNYVRHQRTCKSAHSEYVVHEPKEKEDVPAVACDETAASTYICSKCKRSFNHQDELDQHVQVCTARLKKSLRYSCVCGNKYTWRASYAKHLQTCASTANESTVHDHEEEEAAPGTADDGAAASMCCCPKCHRSFHHQDELDQHVQACTARLKRPLRHSCACGMKYSSLGNFVKHQRTCARTPSKSDIHDPNAETESPGAADNDIAAPVFATPKSQRPPTEHSEPAQHKYRVRAKPFKRELQYSCSCGKKYRWEYSLIKHSRTCASTATESDMRDSEEEDGVSGLANEVTAAPTYACPKCERSFSHQDGCDQHVQMCTVRVKRHLCGCGKKYSSLGNYVRHQRTCKRAAGESDTHGREEQGVTGAYDGTASSAYACPRCERSFSHQDELDQHVEVCTPPYKRARGHSCGCGKNYILLGNYVKHFRKCEANVRKCGASFHNESNVQDCQQETPAVAGDKAAQGSICPNCARSFSQEIERDQHLQSCQAASIQPDQRRSARNYVRKHRNVSSFGKHLRSCIYDDCEATVSRADEGSGVAQEGLSTPEGVRQLTETTVAADVELSENPYVDDFDWSSDIASPYAKKKRISSHRTPKYKCAKCDKTYTNRYRFYVRHTKECLAGERDLKVVASGIKKRKKSVGPMFICHKCGREYQKNYTVYLRHIEMCTGPDVHYGGENADTHVSSASLSGSPADSTLPVQPHEELAELGSPPRVGSLACLTCGKTYKTRLLLDRHICRYRQPTSQDGATQLEDQSSGQHVQGSNANETADMDSSSQGPSVAIYSGAARQSPTGKEHLACPACRKTYKSLGWLKRHIPECEPRKSSSEFYVYVNQSLPRGQQDGSNSLVSNEMPAHSNFTAEQQSAAASHNSDQWGHLAADSSSLVQHSPEGHVRNVEERPGSNGGTLSMSEQLVCPSCRKSYRSLVWLNKHIPNCLHGESSSEVHVDRLIHQSKQVAGNGSITSGMPEVHVAIIKATNIAELRQTAPLNHEGDGQAERSLPESELSVGNQSRAVLLPEQLVGAQPNPGTWTCGRCEEMFHQHSQYASHVLTCRVQFFICPKCNVGSHYKDEESYGSHTTSCQGKLVASCLPSLASPTMPAPMTMVASDVQPAGAESPHVPLVDSSSVPGEEINCIVGITDVVSLR